MIRRRVTKLSERLSYRAEPHPNWRPNPATRDMDAFAQSLKDLERLSIDRVLVAHGPPVLGDGRDAIAAALNSFKGG